MGRWIRKVMLVLIGTTALGGLVSGVVIALTPQSYQADAYVALAPMPSEVRDTLGRNLAASIDQAVQAGPLQGTVLTTAATQLHGWTADDLRHRTQVTALSYTPLSRITVSWPVRDEAMAAATAVAQTWVDTVTGAYEAAFSAQATALSQRDASLSQEIAATQQAIVAGTTKCGAVATRTRPACASPTLLSALQAQLVADLQDQTDIRNQLTQLGVRQAQVVRIAYLAIPADADTTSLEPDGAKALGIGLGVGFATGLLIGFWLARKPVRGWLRSAAQAAQPA